MFLRKTVAALVLAAVAMPATALAAQASPAVAPLLEQSGVTITQPGAKPNFHLCLIFPCRKN